MASSNNQTRMISTGRAPSFLGLPKDIRNRIYELAIEPPNGEFAILLVPTPPKPYTDPHWKFFALTQTSRQIRAEYRPIWMQNTAVRFGTIGSSEFFVEVFMPNDADLKHPPKSFEIAWEHGVDSDYVHWYNITHLLRLRAFCPRFHCSFVPYRITPECSEYLYECEACYSRRTMGEIHRAPKTCPCPIPERRTALLEQFCKDQMDYMDAVGEFVHSTNKAWLDDVRENKIRVSFNIPRTGCLLIRIVYRGGMFADINYYARLAREHLLKWGIFDLECASKVDWVVVYEEHLQSEDRGFEVEASSVHQVSFTKST